MNLREWKRRIVGNMSRGSIAVQAGSFSDRRARSIRPYIAYAVYDDGRKYNLYGPKNKK